MLWISALFLVQVVVAIDPRKSWPVLEQSLVKEETFEQSGNGFPSLTPKTKALIEQCVIDKLIDAQIQCGNNPYAGLVRLAFHDCGTFDASASTNRGGCNAWMTKKCTKFDQCEYTAHENNGLQMWVDPLDAVYDSAAFNYQKLSSYVSRADFWHLAAYRAVRRSSSFHVNAKYHAGRVDPPMPNPGPRFPGRLPDAIAWSEMQRVGQRNGMDDFNSAVLLGAHTLGQCHPTTSGYQGAWDPTPFVFDEQFWDGLLDLKWFVHNIEAVNSQTGNKTFKTQFSLGGKNYDRSVMLFSDMGAHVNLDQCNVGAEDVANKKCPVNDNPSGLSSALRNWADSKQSFFDHFADAWETMTQWGCTTCYEVDDYGSQVDCRGYKYPYTCKQAYSQGTSYWKPGYKTPCPPPTHAPSPPNPYGKPTTRPPTPPPYKPTTRPPTPPPYKPTTHPPTKPPYTYAPKTTLTYAPTTTPYPTTTPPETTYPETTYPETTPPETTYPETTPPETTYPETTPPETTYPETTPPETTPPYTYPPPPTTTTACPTPSPTYPPPPTTTTTYPPPPTTTTTYPPPPTTTTARPTYPPPTTARPTTTHRPYYPR